MSNSERTLERRNTAHVQRLLLDSPSYLVRRKIFTFLSKKFYIYEPSGRLVGFVKQKAFKLKEDIRVYTDETCSKEMLVIKARSIIDWSAAYDVYDPVADMVVGTLRRKGLLSTFVRDTWTMLDENEEPLGQIEEDSLALGLVRRFVIAIIPQSFTVTVDGVEVARFHQNWNIFVPKLQVDFLVDDDEFDRRLGLAAAVLMSAIEGRQGG